MLISGHQRHDDAADEFGQRVPAREQDRGHVPRGPDQHLGEALRAAHRHAGSGGRPAGVGERAL